MRFEIGSRLLKMMHGISRACFGPLLAERDGNIAMSFALVSIPLCLAIGASVDYARAYNTQSKMQSDLDAALITAIHQVDSADEDAIKANVVQWFNAQADTKDASYTIARASSSDMFLSASDPVEIEEGLAALFQQYLGSVRLTQ